MFYFFYTIRKNYVFQFKTQGENKRAYFCHAIRNGDAFKDTTIVFVSILITMIYMLNDRKVAWRILHSFKKAKI